jgi:hypothetical protein
VTKKTAPVEKTQGGARTAFTDEQIAHVKSKILELLPQGWTIRQVLGEPDMCSMTYLYRDLLPRAQHRRICVRFSAECRGYFRTWLGQGIRRLSPAHAGQAKLEERGHKPNVEQNLAGRFSRMHAAAQILPQKARMEAKTAQILSTFPKGGIQDNTVNRLLLISSSEHHLPNVPMAFFIKPPTPAAPAQ